MERWEEDDNTSPGFAVRSSLCTRSNFRKGANFYKAWGLSMKTGIICWQDCGCMLLNIEFNTSKEKCCWMGGIKLLNQYVSLIKTFSFWKKFCLDGFFPGSSVLQNIWLLEHFPCPFFIQHLWPKKVVGNQTTRAVRYIFFGFSDMLLDSWIHQPGFSISEDNYH